MGTATAKTMAVAVGGRWVGETPSRGVAVRRVRHMVHVLVEARATLCPAELAVGSADEGCALNLLLAKSSRSSPPTPSTVAVLTCLPLPVHARTSARA